MAKFFRANGSTSVKVRTVIQDTASTIGAGKTGLTEASAGLIIATIADTEAATTRYRASSSEVETIATLGTYAAPTAGKCRFREVDAVNHPGLYEIQIADARFAVSGAKSLIITISGASGAAQVHAEIQQDPIAADVVLWKGATAPANTGDAYARLGAPAGASVSADIAAIKTDTAAIKVKTDAGLDAAGVRSAIGMASPNLDTQLAALQSDTDNIQTRLPAALVSGRMSSQVGAMGAGVITAASTAADYSTEIANTVWDELLGFHTTTGSAGWALMGAFSTGGGLDAAGIRDAIGMAAPDLDAQLDAIAAGSLDSSDLLPLTDDVAAVKADTVAIKAKTDSLTFTVAGAANANITHVIADAVRRDGASDTNWGGQP